MPSAREIAEERFAKGEISESELNAIISKVSGGKVEKKSNFITEVLQFIGLGVVGFIGLAIFFGGSSKGLDAANIIDHGNKVTFDFANTSTKSGDVIAYIKSKNGGSERCIHIFEMRPGSISDFTLYCDRVSGSGGTILHYEWADSADKGLVRLAQRRNINW